MGYRGKTVYKVPHPLGTRSRERAGHWEEYGRYKAARPVLAEQQDRHSYEADKDLLGLMEADRIFPRGKGGTALEDYPTLRPMRNKVWARRRSMWEDARAAGLAVPELIDRPDSQKRGMWFHVLRVGPGVTTLKPGNWVLVNHCVAKDLGDVLGADVYEFVADVAYVDPRSHETEQRRNPDGTTTPYLRRMSDTERRSGGDVLAVAIEPPA